MDGLNSSFYLLRWSDHIANYADVFLTLREEEEFVDCSFACEDGVVGAHRLVLAGCSPYLRDLLKRSSNPHPIIFLINVSRSTVLLLMEFIYRGQAHIPHNRLHQLVTLGRTMQIKGLSQIQLPPKYSSVLPSIPRLHGSPDPVTELDDTMLERDSSDDHSLSHENNNNIEDMSDEEDSTPISERVASRSVQQKDIVTMSSPPRSQENDKENTESPPVQNQEKNTESPPVQNQEKTTSNNEKDLSIQKQENNRKSLKDNTPQKNMNQYQTRERSKEKTNQYQTRERSSGSPKKHILDSESHHYVPKPKSKKLEELKELPGCPKTNTMPKKAQEVKKANKVINLKKVKSKINRQKDEKIKDKPGRKENTKVKHPVFKTKKNPNSLKKTKCEPKTRLYNGGLRMKLELGAYAIQHGIEVSQRYILAKYGVKMRPRSIENMMALASVFKRKKPGRKNYEDDTTVEKKRPIVRSEDDSTVERKSSKGRPKPVNLAELTGRPRKSITFDVERFFGRAKRRTEENDRSPKRARESTLVMPVE